MLQPGGKLARIRLPLLTPRLSLRLPQLSDASFLVASINDPPVFRALTARHKPYTRPEEVAWVKGSRQAASRGEKLNLAIRLRGASSPIGGIGLEVKSWENHHGWIGYWLAPPYWHNGYATEAASAICQRALGLLKLHRIDAEVFEFNRASMNVLRKLGFKIEGRRRDILFRGGRWYGEVLFGLVKKDFQPFAQKAT